MFMEQTIYQSLGLYRRRQAFWPRWEIPVLTILVALLICFALLPFVDLETSLIVFLLAVLVATWLGGFGAGMVSMVIGLVVSIYFFRSHALPYQHTRDAVQLSIFVACALVSSFLIASLTRAHIRAEEMTKALTEERLRLDQSRKRVANILESTNDGFIAFDRAWRFTYVNQHMEKLLGKKRDELMGKIIWDEFPEIIETSLYKKYHEAIEYNRIVMFECFVPLLHGWFLVHAHPSEEGLSSYITNITARRNAEQRKDDFIGIVNHELKTPLTSTKIFAEVLQRRFEKMGDTESSGYLSKMDLQLDKLSKLVVSLLNVSKINEGKMELKKEKFSINEVITETIQELKLVNPSHHITFDVLLEIQIDADKEKMKQVVTNLLSNAIKYSPHDREIIVRLTQNPDAVIVSVTDRGIGIPQNQLHRIFDRFFQVNTSPEKMRKYPGLGLGLYISREIIIIHGGTMWVKSEEGKGSTFFFSIPDFRATEIMP